MRRAAAGLLATELPTRPAVLAPSIDTPPAEGVLSSVAADRP
jgi:hypothetical protein